MSRMAENLPHGLDLANWMGDLPPDLLTTPLMDLAIPGTHDSGSFYLDKTFDLQGNLLTKILEWLLLKIINSEALNILGLTVNDVVYNWSVTQRDIGFRGQLNIGVRYFDLRVAWIESDQGGSFYFVHGLHGSQVKMAMEEIAEWLNTHPKEVVLLDFNHFYITDTRTKQKSQDKEEFPHDKLIKILEKTFKGMLYKKPKVPKPGDVTLKKLIGNKHQVIVFYKNKAAADKNHLWIDIDSPWPLGNGTTDVKKMIKFLSDNVEERGKNLNSSKIEFYVSQAILTPDAPTIVGNLGHSLKSVLATPAMPHILEWLKGQRSQSGSKLKGLNIVIADFVDLDFLLAVIKLNYPGVSKPASSAAAQGEGGSTEEAST